MIHVPLALVIAGAGRFDSQRRTVNDILLGRLPVLAARNDDRALRKRPDLRDRLDRAIGDAVPAGESRRGDSGHGAGDSAAWLSVRGAAGGLSAERMGDVGKDMAGVAGRRLGAV